jgi:hypothetical protein
MLLRIRISLTAEMLVFILKITDILQIYSLTNLKYQTHLDHKTSDLTETCVT